MLIVIETKTLSHNLIVDEIRKIKLIFITEIEIGVVSGMQLYFEIFINFEE